MQSMFINFIPDISYVVLLAVIDIFYSSKAHWHHDVSKQRLAWSLKKTGTSIGGNCHLDAVVIDIIYGIQHVLRIESDRNRITQVIDHYIFFGFVMFWVIGAES
jgi:hypothetical protein